MPSLELGPFRLEQRLGRGGMGEVWSAVHIRHRVAVAVKLLHADGEADRAAFAAEVQAVARLDHANVILVFDQGVVDEETARRSEGLLRAGAPWLAMERCSGGSLRDARPLHWTHLRRILTDVLGALACAHARGVLHRDLKPDNVLLASPEDLRPGLKLSDFGLAFAREVDAEDGRAVVLGTPAYMAPEQFRRAWRDYSPATDLYALGCLAWRLATGEPPFGRDRPPEVLALSHLELEPPPFQPAFAVPEGFEDIVRRLLRKDPLQRPRSAAEVLLALEGLEPEATPRTLIPDDWRSGAPPARPLRLFGVGLGLYAARAVPMVGREVERDALWRALVDVYRGGVGRAVLVQGPLGVGKSRLLGWLAERAGETGAASVLRVEHDEDTMGGLAEALARALGAQGLTADALEARAEEWLRRRGVTDPWEWKALRTLLRPAAAQASDSVAFLTPAQRHAVTRRLLERLAAERPLVLWVEDAQWASDTLALVDAFLAAQEATPSAILVVLAVRAESLAERPVEQAQIEELSARVDRIDLGPLPPPLMVQLVEGLLGLSGDLAARVRERAGGNPAFAVQLVGDWVQRGVLVPTGDGFVLKSDAQAVLPDDIHAFWVARLDRALDAFGDEAVAARHALELAATLGTEVDAATWTTACACASLTPPAALVERLARERLVRSTGEADWAFAHNMVRESLLRGALETDRAPLWHAACAYALALHLDGDHHAERLATHLAGAGEPDGAADFLLLAARERVARGEDRAALGLLTTWAEAMEDAKAPPQDVRWGEGWIAEARLLARQGDWEAASGPAERALQGAKAAGWDNLRMAALAVRGEVARGQGNTALALQHLAEARGSAEVGATADPKVLAGILRSLGTLSAQIGEVGRAARLLAEAEGVCVRMRDARGSADCLVARADLARRTGDHEVAAPLLDEAARLHARYGNRAGEAEVHQIRADLARARGDLGAAVAAYRAALTLYESIGSGQVLGPLAGLGAALARQRRHEDARNVLDLALRLADRQGSGNWLGVLHAQFLPVSASLAELDAFDQHLASAREWLRRTREVHPDVADAAERAAALLTERHPARAAAAQALAKEQRTALARGMVAA